jgi:large subunit ribosomal protein L22
MATSTVNRAGTRPGTKAQVRFVRMSASKVRQVLNLIRGEQVEKAIEILHFNERLASEPIEKCLRSAVANAEHNDDLVAGELFVSACYADEGPTLKRFRPRARGRAGRIHKQTCHITIEVSRLTEEELDEARTRAELKSEGRRSRRSATQSAGGDRARRVAKSRAAQADEADAEEPTDEVTEDQTADDQVAGDQVGVEAPEAEAEDVDAPVEADSAEEEATDEVVAEDAVDDDAGDGEEKD